MKGHKFDITPRFSDYDSYGIVHHSNYFKILEESRFKFLEDILGLNIVDLEDNNIRALIINSQINFKKAICANDKISVYNKFIFNENSIITSKFMIVAFDKGVVCNGSMNMVLVNKKNELYFEYPEFIVEVLNRLKYKKISKCVLDISQL